MHGERRGGKRDDRVRALPNSNPGRIKLRICREVLAWRLITNLHANNDENESELELKEREHLGILVRRR